MRLAVIWIALAASSCNDRTREIPPVVFETPAADVGADLVDLGPPPTPDVYCDGALDGASCALPGGFGACVRQECVLIACESAFGDCTEADGCETSLADVAHCGACGNSCGDAQLCAAGPAGFVCAAGTVCPLDEFDLDSDPANGCEWTAEWEAPFALAPPDLEIEAAGWTDQPIVAGGSEDLRVSVVLGNTPQTTVWPEARGDAVAVDVRLQEAFERVVWSDGVSLRQLSDQDISFLQPPCEPGVVPRRFVGATERYVATQFEVFEVDPACGPSPCLQPFFGLGDYQSAVFADFGASELATCDGCALSLDPQCWGRAQCRDVAFDPIVCGACVPGGCPTLEIVDIVEHPAGIAVITSRGVLVVDADGLVRRTESRFDPGVAGGPRFVAGLSSADSTTLVHSSAFVRVLNDQLLPVFPDLGLSFDPETATMLARHDTILAVNDDVVRLIQPGRASGRTAFLDISTAPGIQGLSPVTAVETPDGFRVFYRAAGQIYTRLIARRQ